MDTWINLIHRKQEEKTLASSFPPWLLSWGSSGRQEQGSRPTVGAASDAVGGHGVFAVLGDRPHRQLVLPQCHWSCLLQDGDSLPGDTLRHLTGHCLDNTAGRGDRGKCDRWLLVHACGRAEETRISHCPGLEAGFILINTLAGACDIHIL